MTAMMEDLFEHLMDSKGQDVKEGDQSFRAFDAQVHFQNGHTAAGAIAEGPIPGIYKLKTLGQAPNGQNLHIDVFFAPASVIHVDLISGVAEKPRIFTSGDNGHIPRIGG